MDYCQVHFFVVIFQIFRRSLRILVSLYRKTKKEERTSSVALIVFDSLNVNLSSFYPFYVCWKVFTFRQNWWWRNDRKERERFLNLWRFTPLLPSFFPYILHFFISSSFLSSVQFSNLMLTHRYLLTNRDTERFLIVVFQLVSF